MVHHQSNILLCQFIETASFWQNTTYQFMIDFTGSFLIRSTWIAIKYLCFSLKNVVYLELCRRGYTVTIGKTPDGEVDFVAQKQNDRLYVQVTQEIKSEKTEKREYERLLEIRDNYPKYVLRTDEFAGGNYQGIKSMHIADFLLCTEY